MWRKKKEQFSIFTDTDINEKYSSPTKHKNVNVNRQEVRSVCHVSSEVATFWLMLNRISIYDHILLTLILNALDVQVNIATVKTHLQYILILLNSTDRFQFWLILLALIVWFSAAVGWHFLNIILYIMCRISHFRDSLLLWESVVLINTMMTHLAIWIPNRWHMWIMLLQHFLSHFHIWWGSIGDTLYGQKYVDTLYSGVSFLTGV